MSHWGIYSQKTLDNNAGYQESFEFANPVKKTQIAKTPTLESVLPTQGWPQAELSEVCSGDTESVLQLLLPTLTKLNAENRWITLISPPADINQKLFAYYGIDPSRVLLIHPKNDVDDKVTMNKALKNGTSGIVILWASQLNKRYLAQWRKSVKQGNSTGIIINMTQKSCNSNSIALSFNVRTKNKSLSITGIKLFAIQQTQNDEILFSKIDLGSTLDRHIPIVQTYRQEAIN